MLIQKLDKRKVTMPFFGSKESQADKEARKAHEVWAAASVKRFHKASGWRNGYWAGAEKRLKELLSQPDNLRQPILVRVYEDSDAKKAAKMFELEANILAEKAYIPVSQAWASAKPATSVLGGIGLLAPQTLTVSYERRTENA